MYPQDFYYTKEHEWVKVEGEKGIVGITDYAQKSLGDIVYVELPPLGKTVKFMETAGTIESVKAASDIFSPITGEVLEVNENLKDSPELINKDPHGNGWLFVVKLHDKTELKKLMPAVEYEKYVDSLSK
ncbi:MAG: glycine cleavage system protein GcvH [Candidatus Aminicenantia bacterium]